MHAFHSGLGLQMATRSPDEDARDRINASGYAFQLAVESLLDSESSSTNWNREASEYRWTHRGAGEEGFVDLVARNEHWRLVIECKKKSNANWIFIRSHAKSAAETRLSTLFALADPAQRCTAKSWAEAPFNPASPEAEYWTTMGASPDQRPLLERTCTELIRACEAIADDEADLNLKGPSEEICLYFPAIVTNAKLLACDFDPAKCSLESGETPSLASFDEVPWIRYRKTLGIAFEVDPKPTPSSLGTLNRASSISMFVISASSLGDFLRKFSVALSRPFAHKQYSELTQRLREHCRVREE